MRKDKSMQTAASRFMHRALQLARRGAGLTSPNPTVGAVVVRQGKIIGEGYHIYERRDHAEVVALDRAGSSARGGDLYVTLEPCAHHGRTPPCTDRIIQSGIRRIFVAVRDPNPRVSGGGIGKLRKSGIEVQEGILGEKARRLNRQFFHFITSGKPFTTLKLALSLDGKIATRTGESQWITGEQSRRAVHRLRFLSDAILVGVETVLTDDPSLDVRWIRRKSILKTILDRRLRTPVHAALFGSGDPVVIFHSASAPSSQQAKLSGSAILISVNERSDLLGWEDILSWLGRIGVCSLLIEGGSRVATTALESGAVQQVQFFYGPKLLGGREIPAVGGNGCSSLQAALQIENPKYRRLGSDWMVRADVVSRLNSD
jgi:diaminohydroxyphosphoribosylaminopyrimidine deaminase/5-amino-6-(5-phosphoribosylamino)uracil reductase